MRHFGWILAAPVAALLLAACGDEEAPRSASPSDEPSSTNPGQLYTGVFTVLEGWGHGPQLCSGVRESFPPQCGGPDIAGWNWDEAPDAESADGVTWGFYSVTGTWDGTRFTLTEPPLAGTATSPVAPDASEFDFSPPCEPPAGGWVVVDAATADEAGRAAAEDYAYAQPDFAGTWIDSLARPNILTFSFTGDLETHEAALRGLWGGPLCVTGAERSMQELIAIQDEIVAAGPGVPATALDLVSGEVTLDVFVEDGQQAELDERYGEGVVRVSAALRPVE
ncbi:hypothetical protein [Jiangella sp. DSM 45060]|uniref:hypothetical protein n=1 Tax=Jiangella sp. DSM 45060 TaxID=1798224 RepID=UPI00087B7D3A|nr:hypothetical protein [Jiangella sp. DSM 45060]SDT68519.1 hypothetical protein SAMN04515669_5882 [Jiangella sp. DSM 45060]